MITEPGIYNISERDYHADPCATPSLSSSIAKLLVRRSPMHARFAHPRLNPDFERNEATNASDLGSALHKMLLGKGAEIVSVAAKDWRTDAAKTERDQAWKDGKTPILAKTMAEALKCVDAARVQMKRHEDARLLFEPGASEQVMVWREGPVWCRAMVDRMPDTRSLPLLDLKTTQMSAAPQDWERRLSIEYAFQDAFYRRGAAALGRSVRHPMIFIVIEQEAPFGLSVMAADPTLQAVADREVDRAIALWGDCMRRNEWPGYPTQTAYVAAKPWQLNELMESM